MYLLQEPAFIYLFIYFLIFAIVSSISFYFCSDLYDFFPSTNFGDFCLLFLVALGIRLGCLFDIFPVCLLFELDCTAVNFPLALLFTASCRF